ncbi:MAG: ATP-binding protein [Bryobacterales bacterium]|nr:ATP-binding protein [Bryobacterales bacterium]
MLTSVYIDNFACFVNFEFQPARKQLLYGANGSGKTKFCRAILSVQRLVLSGEKAEAVFPTFTLTRWQEGLPAQTFEIEAKLDERIYRYRLVVERWGTPPVARVQEESVACEGKPIFAFQDGEVQLFDDQFEAKVKFPFDRGRSALSTVVPGPDNQKLSRFLNWFTALWFFQIDPFRMTNEADTETSTPTTNLSNFASWYRHLAQDDPRGIGVFLDDLKESLDSFSDLNLKAFSANTRTLLSSFSKEGRPSLNFALSELSEGQRCLIGLYAILHFAIKRGQTVFLDEPDNFVALREIQPWLTAVEEALEEHSSQVFLISHHPEILNQWLPESGVRFKRENFGPARVTPYRHPKDTPLLPAEVVARGWDDE